MRDARLVPRAALPYLVVPAHTQHAELAPLRREALDVLAAGYRSTRRTLLGVLAWAAVAGGATLLATLPWLGAATGPTVALAVLGAVLLAAGLTLAVGVVRSGRRITGAAAAWLRVPAGDTDHDAAGLLGVVRWRVVLAVAVAAAATALALTLTYLLARTGGLGSTHLAGTTTESAPGTAPAFLVAALAAAALTTAGAALGTLGGVRTVTEAAWTRPTLDVAVPRTVAGSVPPAPAPGAPVARPTISSAAPLADPAGHLATPASVAGAPRGTGNGAEGPPTVEIDLSGLRAADAHGYVRPGPDDGSGRHGGAAESGLVEVVLPDGRTLAQGTTLLGRQPLPRPEDVVDEVLTLTDQTVTKTHAAVTVEGADVSVVDRASTNGTILEAPDGSLVRCRPWQVTTVRVPAIIHLGRTRLHVRAAAARRPLEVA
ncbi:FHA domain-containing protein [Georgenia sp. H159]|uniref:FHA domain-containing protein n=1 Tax=Georgenia sp. H159 TaxID=3076115 RepID=UPI002D781C44|nr:FHA domain-containing protein [Georgenia sp. H159]